MTSSTRVGGPPRAPDQTVVYAIGDVHGRLDLLERLTEQLAVETEAAAREGKGTIAVFLGDYIDKGPDPAGVVEHLIRFRDQAACETIFLRGNHEDVLLSLVDGDEDSARWLEYGGVDTLRSYGVTFRASNPSPSVEKLRQATVGAVPPEHIAFLRESELTVTLGDYIFVHAGLRPDRLIEEQTDSDMMWFRYYDDEPPIWSGTVVHGHSVNPRPIRGRARIGIDTGAYATDALTALRLEGDRQDFLKISLNPEDGTPEVDFWDTVDRAFAGDGGRAAAPRRARPPASVSADSRAKPAARKGKPAKPARAQKAKPATKPATKPARRQGFPAVGVAAAAAAALAAASVAGVLLYKPQANVEASDLSPQSVAAELSAESPAAAEAPAATKSLSGDAGQPPNEAATDGASDAALRPLSPSEAGDSAQEAQPAKPASTTPPPARPAAAPPKPAPVASTRPAASSAPPAPPPPAGGVRVQIAATPSAEAARREWVAVADKFPTEMNGKGLQTEEVQVDDRTLVRVMVAGFASPAEARAFCDRLRQAGRGCIVRAGN